MTIQDVKVKYGVAKLDFYRLLNGAKETIWLVAANESKSIRFFIKDIYIEHLKENPKRNDISIKSSRKHDNNGNFLFEMHILSLTGMVTTIALFEKELAITLIPNLKSIKFNKIENFEDEYINKDSTGELTRSVREKILLEFEILFTIEGITWRIPYAIVLEKIYSKINSEINYVYRKCRARLQKINEIEILSEPLYPFLLHTLLLLDRTRIDYINSSEFENYIDTGSFFFNNDLKYNSNKDCIYIISRKFYRAPEENHTNIILNKSEQVSFKGSEFIMGNEKYGHYYLNIIPIGFFDSYIKALINPQGKIIDLYQYSDLDKSIEGRRELFNTESSVSMGSKIFQGSYVQCFEFLKDLQNVAKVERSIHEENRKIQQRISDLESFEFYQNGGAESYIEIQE